MLGIINRKSGGSKRMSLDQVTKLLSQLRLPTSLVFTPLNWEEERRKFFNSDTYNPKFTYRIIKNSNKEIFEELKNLTDITDIDPRIEDFYLQLIKAKFHTNEMMYAVGDNELFTQLSMKSFKMPSPILFRNAARILRGNVRGYKLVDESKYSSVKNLGYAEISKVFELAFEEIGLDGWKAEKSINIANNGVKVGTKMKEVLMDPDIKKSALELRKTVVHEMVHIIRSHNGGLTGFDALTKSNLHDYLDVEEGLACYNEELMGVLKKKDLDKRAGKAWAIYIGKDISFRNLYNATLSFAQKNLAFDIVYRVKRGLGDTSKPGIYTRDASYFRGYRRVRKKLQEDLTLYEKLFAGKIGFKQVRWVEDGLLPFPKLIPKKDIFERIFKKAGI